MRGYRILREAGRLDDVDAVKRQLAATALPVTPGSARTSIFADEHRRAELAVRQFLLIGLGGPKFNKALLRAVADPSRRIAYPMPQAWRRVVEAGGFRVDNLRSRLLCMGWLFLAFGYGVLGLCRQLASSISARSAAPLAGSVYFDGIGKGNLPHEGPGPSHDVISWYCQWPGRAPEATAITHGAPGARDGRCETMPTRRVDQAVPMPRSWAGIARLAAWSVRASLTALIALIRGRWWNVVMLRDAGRAAAVRLCEQKDLPVEYMFHNSGWLYRPLWTYAVERRGVRVHFYFYSTNCEVFKRRDGYPPQTGSWELCSWSTYLVWNEGQADFVRRAIGEADIRIVGPIGFSDDDAPLPSVDGDYVAAFDVQPMRDSVYRSLALGFEYYLADVACSFADDIAVVSDELGMTLLWKRKREIGSAGHPRYRATLDELMKSSHVQQVAPSRAAQHLIAMSRVVVSMPYTSTALIARSMNKPSCYYDPTGKLQRDDRAAHGIPIIQSRDELKDWIVAHSVVAETVNPERNT